MKKTIIPLLLVIIAMMTSTNVLAQQIKPFKSGDRVAFVGNSITDGGHYHSYIWLYYMTRFPDQKMWMGNFGIGGDTNVEILKRLQGDVLDKQPTVITFTFGMNDSGYQEHNSDTAKVFADHKVATAIDLYHKIETKLLAFPSARIVQIGTSPYDQTARLEGFLWQNKNDAIVRMIDAQRASAAKNGWEFIDFNEPMVQLNTEKQATDSAFTICGKDRIHPDNDGHMYMTYLFLKAQGMEGKPVARVSVDAKKGETLVSENCRISNLVRNKTELSFDYLANALPYPLDTIARGGGFTRPQSLIKQLVPRFQELYNNEQLCVKGLKGSYALLIDETVIDTLSAEALSTGVNLSDYCNTPQYQQALKIMTLNEDRWDMERRIRDWAWVKYDYFLLKGMPDPTTKEAEQRFIKDKKDNWWLASRTDIYNKMKHDEIVLACENYIRSLVDSMYKLNKPITHRVRLIKTNK